MYCSRLHYFSDWINENQKRGNLENITQKLGGITLNRKLNFISQNRRLYPQLKSQDNYDSPIQIERININTSGIVGNVDGLMLTPKTAPKPINRSRSNNRANNLFMFLKLIFKRIKRP